MPPALHAQRPHSGRSATQAAEWWRRGYWDNRFEIEAREFAADNLYRFRALLRQANQPSNASR